MREIVETGYDDQWRQGCGIDLDKKTPNAVLLLLVLD